VDASLWLATAAGAAVAATCLVLALAAARARLARWRERERRRRLRSLALALALGGADEAGELTPEERRALAALLAGYAARLSGPARRRVLELLAAEGYADAGAAGAPHPLRAPGGAPSAGREPPAG